VFFKIIRILPNALNQRQNRESKESQKQKILKI